MGGTGFTGSIWVGITLPGANPYAPTTVVVCPTDTASYGGGDTMAAMRPMSSSGILGDLICFAPRLSCSPSATTPGHFIKHSVDHADMEMQMLVQTGTDPLHTGVYGDRPMRTSSSAASKRHTSFALVAGLHSSML